MGSSWLVDVAAGGSTVIESLVVANATVTGGGLLRAVGSKVELKNVAVEGLEARSTTNENATTPTDSVIQLQPTRGPSNSTVGSVAWLEAANQ